MFALNKNILCYINSVSGYIHPKHIQTSISIHNVIIYNTRILPLKHWSRVVRLTFWCSCWPWLHARVRTWAIHTSRQYGVRFCSGPPPWPETLATDTEHSLSKFELGHLRSVKGMNILLHVRSTSRGRYHLGLSFFKKNISISPFSRRRYHIGISQKIPYRYLLLEEEDTISVCPSSRRWSYLGLSFKKEIYILHEARSVIGWVRCVELCGDLWKHRHVLTYSKRPQCLSDRG